MTIYLTSDLHLCHNQNFIYEARGFNNIEEHSRTIVNNINEVVQPDDFLYILGDLMLGDNFKGIELLKKIKCENIKVILGNHDTDARINLYYNEVPHIQSVVFSTRIKYHKWSFILSHYPMMTTDFMDDKSLRQRMFCLCGHRHTNDPLLDIYDGSYHVELDAHNNYPISIDKIIEDIRQWWERQIELEEQFSKD